MHLASPYEVFTAIDGYYENLEQHEVMIRNLAYVVYCANTTKGKQASIQKFWPIGSVDVEKKGPMEVDAALWNNIEKVLKKKPKNK